MTIPQGAADPARDQILDHIARHQEYRQAGMGHGERLEQLDAVQLRHRDVRQDEIHRQSCADGGEGLRTIRGLTGAVPALSQHRADQPADTGLVVHHEDLHPSFERLHAGRHT